MAKEQFIFGVRINVMRVRLIVKCLNNLKQAIEYGRLLEVANLTARCAASPNVIKIFRPFRLLMRRKYQIRRLIALTVVLISKLVINLAALPVEYKHRMWRCTIARFWKPTGLPKRKLLIRYTFGQLGHKSVECRLKPPNAMPSGNFVKGQWPANCLDTTRNNKPKMLQSNMIVQSDEDGVT